MLKRSGSDYGPWTVTTSSDPNALAVVDGIGRFASHGPHYSRRTPGSRTFTGVGKELVLITISLDAVFAVVYQRTPSARGTGSSRGRTGLTDSRPRYVWRNMLFRNLGNRLSSELIEYATWATYMEWHKKYGSLPLELLRTEIDPKRVKSSNPGYCFKRAGYHSQRMVRGKIYLYAPCITRMLLGDCSCCGASPKLTDQKLVKEKSNVHRSKSSQH